MARLSKPVVKGAKINMAEILTHKVPFEPSPRTHHIASSTRNPTATEKKFRENEQLRGVVYDHDLVHHLVGPALNWAKKRSVDMNNTEHCHWLGRVDPRFTHHLLPPVANSEHDIRVWFLFVFAHVAAAIIRAILVNDFRLDRAPEECIPFIASSPGKKSTPDGYVSSLIESWKKLRADGSEPTDVILEFKHFNAMTSNIFADLVEAMPVRPRGSKAAIVIPFVWPEDEEEISRQAKVLVQVWSQMYTHKVDYAILSSYRSTVYLYRGGPDRNLLFMSSTYGIDEALPAIFAWMAQAMNLIPNTTLELPKLDMTCLDRNNWSDWWASQHPSSMQPGLATLFAKAYREGEFRTNRIVHQPAESTTPRAIRKRRASGSDDDKTPVAKRRTTRSQVQSLGNAQAGPSHYNMRMRY